MTLRLLDLFSGAGGAAQGYALAGFEVVGVDLQPQPHYPYEHHVGDAMTWPLDGYDAIHASPPCQRWSMASTVNGRPAVDLLTPMLARLQTVSVPWVVENVPGAPMPHSVEVCGAALGLVALDDDGTFLVLRRHRWFVSSVVLLVPPCACRSMRRLGARVGGVYGSGGRSVRAQRKGGGGVAVGHMPAQALMGLDLPIRALTQAIPPAYTQLLGDQLMAVLDG
jgi:DNA (cytosine-5)-methyltransferase 1